MSQSTDGVLARTQKLVDALHALRQFTGQPADFWRSYLEGAGRLAMAREALLVVRLEDPAPWTVSGAWPARPAAEDPLVSAAAADAHAAGLAIRRVSDGTRADPAIAVRLEVGAGEPEAVLVLRVAEAPDALLESSMLLLRLISDVPAAYSKERALGRATGDVVRFAEALDLMVLLNADTRFVKAAMTLANELASRMTCSRVSVGWLDSGYAKLIAMSHVEKFDERTTAVQVVQACMEESADQDEEIVWPAPQGFKAITRAHEEYARSLSPGALVTLPVRLDGQVVGALTCERAQGRFSEADVSALRLICDQAARRLGDLKRQDRWFGARLLDGTRAAFSYVLGVRHTWSKLAGVAIAALFWFLAFGTWSYRIEGAFLLKTDDLVFLPAPFDGYIEHVDVQVGDEVKAGQVLLGLDTRELTLDEAAAVADISRQAREAEKAMAKNTLADMKIAQALELQARARLDKVRYNLENAKVKAPMAGLVVEGDLKKMLGAPVRRGDILFKIARVERMYAEVGIEERDVHEVKVGGKGELAFVSRPNQSFPVIVERLDPMAISRDGRNEFNVRLRFNGETAPWWRPGMSGVAKLDCGQRNVAWLLTHRTIDFLRLMLWW